MTDAAKRVGEMWKTMNDAAKKPYTDLATQDKVRHDDQMKSLSSKGYFLLPDGKKSSEMHKGSKSDLKPKRVASSYMLFLKENIASTMKEKSCKLPEASK